MKFPISVVGRALFSVPFIVFGLGHFGNAAQMAGMVPAWVPGGIFWVYFTGAALLAAALSFNLRKQERLAGLLASLLLAVFAFAVHLPAMTRTLDPGDAVGLAYQMGSFAGFFKDLGLAGGALLIAGQAKA